MHEVYVFIISSCPGHLERDRPAAQDEIPEAFAGAHQRRNAAEEGFCRCEITEHRQPATPDEESGRLITWNKICDSVVDTGP